MDYKNDTKNWQNQPYFVPPSAPSPTAQQYQQQQPQYQQQFQQQYQQQYQQPYQQHQNPQQQYPQPMQPNVEVKYGYCDLMQKHRPQSNSISGGLILLLTSGLHIAWGIWRWFIADPWVYLTNRNLSTFTLCSWYLGAIIGAFIIPFFINKLRKKTIFIICSGILIISNVLYIIWYLSVEAILLGRLIAGIAHGILYTTVITHISENNVKEMRGRIVTQVATFLTVSIFLTVVIWFAIGADYTNPTSITFNNYNDMIIGIFGCIYSVAGLITTFFFTQETIPWLLRNGLEQEAISTLLKLRNETMFTWMAQQEFNEIKLTTEQDSRENANILSNNNSRPLMILTAIRILSFLSNNILMNMIILIISQSAMLLANGPFMAAPLILIGARVLGTIIPTWFIDSYPRKAFVTFSGSVAGVLTIVFGILLLTIFNPFTPLFVISIILQFSYGYGVEPLVHIISAEGFSMTKKPLSIAFASTVEYLLQIIYLIIAYSMIEANGLIEGVTFSSGVLFLILTGVLYKILPNTSKLSLGESRDLFRGINRQLPSAAAYGARMT